jgi:signal transduction histidine kinase
MFRLRDGTVGLRFTVLYSASFLASGAVLLTLAVAFSGVELSSVTPASGQTPTGGAAAERISELEAQLADVNSDHARQLLVGSLLALGVMVVVSLLIGRAMARRVLRPLRTITAATRGISADDLDRRLAVTGPEDEVKDLADTIDGLLARLEASFVAQRRFVANASHELRTPLTTMRALVDVAAAKTDVPTPTVALANRIRPQIDGLDRLLNGLLVLARAQHSTVDEAAVADLSDVAERAVTDCEAAIETKQLDVTTDLADEARTRGDMALLERMTGNLIENALVHNHQGGWIRITTSMGGDEARLVVESGGAVLDQREVDELARPFRRLAADRTGSESGAGLGLSIVAAIAAAHGGRLALTARPDGGLRAEVALPTRPASALVAT